MPKKAQEDKPKPKRLQMEPGELAFPVTCGLFVIGHERFMSEAEWVRTGRPLVTIRYTARGPNSNPRYVYGRTFVDACQTFSLLLTCPSDTVAIAAGVSLNGVDTFGGVDVLPVGSEDAGNRILAKRGGPVTGMVRWDHSLTADRAQRYRVPGEERDVALTPQFSPGTDRAPAPAKPKRPRKPVRGPDVTADGVMPYQGHVAPGDVIIPQNPTGAPLAPPAEEPPCLPSPSPTDSSPVSG